MMKINSLHLFAGIGGGILADKILGHRIVGAVEIEPYCRAVLKQRQEEGWLEHFPIFDDVKTFKGDEINEPIDLICGGFPCQDISTAGRGQGIEGTKSRLFYELIRICGAIRPRYIFLENSPAITGRGLGACLKEIAALGYDAAWDCISAGQLGAPHRRARWWCLCYFPNANGKRELQPKRLVENVRRRLSYLGMSGTFKERAWSKNDRKTIETKYISDANSMGRDKNRKESNQPTEARLSGLSGNDNGNVSGWWKVEPPLGRVVDEFPNRLDAIKGLGNAQVPVCAALAFYLLLERFCDND